MKHLLLFFISSLIWAKPHFNQQLIEHKFTEPDWKSSLDLDWTPTLIENEKGLEVIRVQIDWSKQGESEIYSIGQITRDWSGSEALYLRSKHQDALGSYRGEILDPENDQPIYFDSVGTGMEYRLLTRAMSFRFPAFDKKMKFRLWAEHPASGEMQIVLDTEIDPDAVLQTPAMNVQTWLISPAQKQPALAITFYAEGYKAGMEQDFLDSVKKAMAVFKANQFPLQEHYQVRAVFHTSNTTLGRARNLGEPVPEKDSFLGMYYPYWDNMGRWYHILYPTRESKLRNGLAQAIYDYPIILVNDSQYWGVGNYNSHTAIPSDSSSFTYLLLHEFGHFMGLNEEYAEPAPNRTELTFAPGIYEPWSQNTTFLRDPKNLKWAEFVTAGTPIPTPAIWTNTGKIGAYKGGYSSAPGLNHKPSLSCTMDSAKKFCTVCAAAIKNKLLFDLGM